MKVVSNAGPLIALGKLGRLDVLQKLYGVVLVAHQVYEETVTRGIALGAPDAHLTRDYFSRGIFQKKQVNPTRLSSLTQIHLGEKATIELALNLKADLVLMDDAAAREIAKGYGLKLKGTLAGTKIRETQRKIGTNYSHQGDVREIMALGHHLSADENIGRFIFKPFQQLQNRPLAGGGITIHSGNAGLRKKAFYCRLHFFGTHPQMFNS